MAQALYKGMSKSVYATSLNLYYNSTDEGLLAYIVSEGIKLLIAKSLPNSISYTWQN